MGGWVERVGAVVLGIGLLSTGVVAGEGEREFQKVVQQSFQRLEQLCREGVIKKEQCPVVKHQMTQLYLGKWRPGEEPWWCKYFPKFCGHLWTGEK